ncbi:unnamed protein product [Rotaria sp. Silwood1]|nr:unnamed protein product [Rotaria sp. Silwood1]CAF1634882.1 unnamed protein product [Rotaria sp. Silwood1]CAF3752423.1 unnamed protein product [Rotaria sp. Silwood1]CAF3847141.1 unnamed protein product [Rotaria sp. Silwood1]CAF4564298.1 unnamed protein product [Rotaria sp. Silwood1]
MEIYKMFNDKVVDNNSVLLFKLINKLIHSIEEQSLLIVIKNSVCENSRISISTIDTAMISNQVHFINYQFQTIEILRQMITTVEEMKNSDNIRHLIPRPCHTTHYDRSNGNSLTR